MARLAPTFFCLTVILLPTVATRGAAAPAAPAKAPPVLKEFPDYPPAKQVIPVPVAHIGFNGMLSSDGRWLVAPDNQGNENGVFVSVFDLATSQRVRTLPFATHRAHQSILGVALSADGKVLVASGGTSAMDSVIQVPQINVWDFAGGRLRWTLTGFKHDHRSLSLSADGRWLASSMPSSGGKGGELRLWALSTGKPILALDDLADVNDCCVSPDGKSFVWLGPKSLRLYDVATAKETAVVPYNVKKAQDHVRISPDGKSLVTSGYRLAVLWDLPAKTPKKLIAGGSSVSLPCFTTDGRLVLSFTSKAVYFNGATGEAVGAVSCERPKNYAVGLTTTADGKTLATIASDRVRIFDASRLEPAPPLEAAPDPMTAVQGDFPDVPATGGTSSTTSKTTRTVPPTNPPAAGPASPPAPSAQPPTVATTPGKPATPATHPAAPPSVATPVKPPVPAVTAEGFI